MRVKKAIKKVAALVAGASMVGATLMGASAAGHITLATYPGPFITDGVFDAVLVVGDGAKAEDVIGVTDIATSLQFAAKTTSSESGTSTGTTVEGDHWLVGTRGDFLELTDGQINEDFDAQITRISETELAALADATARTDKGNAPYEQFLRLEDGSVIFEENTETDVVADYVKYENNDIFLNYSLEFTTSWESDIEDSSGNADATQIFLSDYEDETIMLLGKPYTVLKARRTAAAQAGVELTFLGGDVTDTIEEGETKTYTVNGKEYEVENTIVTDSGTIFTQIRVNGELTKKLQEDETETLNDGSIIGIADILPNEAGDVTADIVRFYLGAQKITVKDTNIANTIADSSKLTINDETVSDATIRITGTNSSTDFKIDTIEIDLKSDDKIWVAPGERLTESSDIDPDTATALKAMGLDIFYAGLTDEPSNTIKLDSVSDDRYELIFKNVDGNEIRMPFAFDNDSVSTGGPTLAIWGDKTDKFVIDPNGRGIADDQFFILTDKTNSISGVSDVVQYKGADKVTDDGAEAKFKILSTGETVSRSVQSVTAGAKITLNIGGQEYTFNNITDAGSNDFSLNITAGPSGKSHEALVTENGQLITVYANSSVSGNSSAKAPSELDLVKGFSVKLVEVAKQTDSRTQPVIVNYTISASATEDKVDASRVTADGLNVTSTDYDSDVSEGMNAYGLHVVDTKDSTNPREVVMTVPRNQRVPQVYLTSGVTTSKKGSSTTSTVTEIVKIDVGATKLASKVRGKELTQHLILVGGPCANEATATVVGKPWVGGAAADNCAEGYVDGQATIKLYTHPEDKYALLVAGSSATDTRAAAQVVASKDDYADVFSGHELKVTDTSSASPTVSQVSAEKADATA